MIGLETHLFIFLFLQILPSSNKNLLLHIWKTVLQFTTAFDDKMTLVLTQDDLDLSISSQETQAQANIKKHN